MHEMKLLNSLISAVAITASAALPAAAADFSAKTVVLVHGAFADGSSWNKVIPLLEKAGLKVVAVQNPLDTLENDAAFTGQFDIEASEPAGARAGKPGGPVAIRVRCRWDRYIQGSCSAWLPNRQTE
jgi:ABC-type glycerol-3-phosphate transport system substrate-binding protein